MRNTLSRRLAHLERASQPGHDDAGAAFVADIGSDAGGYWIDGVPVNQQECMQRAPRGPYVVDIDEGDDDAE